MLTKFLILFTCSFLLTSCTYFNIGTNSAGDKYSRCKELRRQMVYTNSNNDQMTGNLASNINTNNQMVAARNGAMEDNLTREYRDLGC